MCFWWFMLICDMIIPIVMVIVGRMMMETLSKTYNGMLGYRTTRSMKKYGYMEILPMTIVENFGGK